jgi:hypothetical protein
MNWSRHTKLAWRSRLCIKQREIVWNKEKCVCARGEKKPWGKNVCMPRHSWENKANIPSCPQQKPSKPDASWNATTLQIFKQYSWWCAGLCLPITWSPLKSPPLSILQVECCVALHPLCGAGHKTTYFALIHVGGVTHLREIFFYFLLFLFFFFYLQ